ncbi:MAG: hypothetical protein J6U54_06885 [Clostridiales bacterium]|nr:hypothetical protein [Clostridiales bacterium]
MEEKNVLELVDGIVAKFDDEEECYRASIVVDNYPVDVFLVDDYENDNTLEALKFAFNKIYKDIDKYKFCALKGIAEKIDPLSDRYVKNEKFTVDDLIRFFKLTEIEIIDLVHISFGKLPSQHIEMNFRLKDEYKDGSYFDDNIVLSAGGSLDEGFQVFDIGQYEIDPTILLEPHVISTGDEIDYSPLAETYSGEVELLDSIVECFFELNDEQTNADAAFELFEKVYKRIDEFDLKAEKFIRQNVDKELSKICEKLEEDLTTDQIISDMFPEIMVFGNEEDFDFAYCYCSDGILNIRLTATGTLKGGFKKFILEYVDRYTGY